MIDSRMTAEHSSSSDWDPLCQRCYWNSSILIENPVCGFFLSLLEPLSSETWKRNAFVSHVVPQKYGFIHTCKLQHRSLQQRRVKKGFMSFV